MKKTTKKKTTTAKPETVLILRTCAADLSSSNGFVWPEKGPVACTDWDATPRCGNGLHGWLWGEGDASLGNWAADAKWLVVEVEESSIVDLGGKVKFPRGVVVHCGDRLSATTFLAEKAPKGKSIIGGTATAGDGGTATAGYGGTATAGDGGTATAGYGGTATAGDCGTLLMRSWDGQRYRFNVFYVGENDVQPNVAYKLDESNKLVKAK